MIEFHSKGRNKLLEIGFGEGYLLSALHKGRVFDVEGIEYASGPIEYLRKQGLKVSQGSIYDKNYQEANFDFIVAFHVLEHVQDMYAFMREIRRVLRSKGRIYFVVPCVTHYSAVRAGQNWRHFGPPGHLWHFSVDSMRRFMVKCGFNPLSVHCISNRPHLTLLAEKTD